MEMNLKNLTESLCCTPERNTTSEINYMPMKRFKK